MGDDWISLNQKFCWWNTSLVARFEWIAAPFCWTFPMKLPISNPSMISDEKSDNFGLVESHKLAINPSLCQWLHMIGWLLVLLIGWLHIFIIIDSLLLMMSVFFKYNITQHFVTLISPIEFHHFSWDLRGARRPLTWRTGEFPATAGETHPRDPRGAAGCRMVFSFRSPWRLWMIYVFLKKTNWSFDEVLFDAGKSRSQGFHSDCIWVLWWFMRILRG